MPNHHLISLKIETTFSDNKSKRTNVTYEWEYDPARRRESGTAAAMDEKTKS